MSAIRYPGQCLRPRRILRAVNESIYLHVGHDYVDHTKFTKDLPAATSD